ncbi:MAG: chitobiase/beta-hexosaminidase C-terminal domain-containing protein [Acidobacteriaceae bacterium]
MPAPTFFPAPGAYTSTTSVTLSDGDSSAMIYYTTDGSTPSASSIRYTEAIPLSISATVRAIAINGTLNSAVTSGYYTISAPLAVVVTLTPTNAIIPVGLNQQFAAFVAGTQTTAVTWTVSGTGCSGTACGTISSSGLYTAPAVVPSSSAVTITATNLSNAAQSASATVVIVSAVGKTYYLAPSAQGGRDSNSGLTASLPWLTPNHTGLNCGDTIIAAASSAYAPIIPTQAVTCAAGNNVVMIQCVTFDACKIILPTTSTSAAVVIQNSYWGISGFECQNPETSASTSQPCFAASPPAGVGNIHTIVFADNVVNGSSGGGIVTYNYQTTSVDYVAIIGNIVYGTNAISDRCGSGISIYQPQQTDTLPGTHIYVAGNIVWSTSNPASGCYDGNGIIFDTFDGDQYPMSTPYSQQAVIDNNISLSNGGQGVLTEYNNASPGPPFAHMYIRHNTTWNNVIGSYLFGSTNCGEILIQKAESTEAFSNLSGANANGCGGLSSNPVAALSVWYGDSTSHVYNNYAMSVGGYYTFSSNSAGFTFGPANLTQASIGFVNPVTPGAPSCGSATSAPNCAAAIIADFTPTNAAAKGYGYQVPSSTPVYDPLYPQWLCSVTNLPSGLVTMGCLTGSAYSGASHSGAVR